MNKIIISTESGSDLPYKIYEPYNIQIVPLHISFGEKTVFDGSFSPQEIDKYFKDSKTLPTTSAINPGEYKRHFKAIYTKYPNSKIIHISYSSNLSATYQNALIASKEFDSSKLSVINSENGSIGAGVVAMLAARIVEKYSDKLSFEECFSLIKRERERDCCVFLPDSLTYLKAGGRVSSVAHLGASVLNLKPTLEVIDGEIRAGKKYRGNIYKIATTYFDDVVKHNNLDKDFIVIGYSYGINKALLFALKRHAHKMGFSKSWCFQLGSAVTCHTGPVCIGIAGVKRHSI